MRSVLVTGVARRLILAVLTFAPAMTRAEGESGVSPSRVSLPSGPGSLDGVGENVTPNLNMGLASYAVPLDIPAGPHGLTPSVDLSYSSGGGASVLGLGWSFGIPSIERMTSEGLPRYDALDTMAAGGGDELVRLPGGDVYRARFEKDFVRYRWVDAAGDGKNGYWISSFPDGRTGYYGARANGSLRSDARVTGALGTFRWHLSEMTDPLGHRITFDYDKDGALSHVRRIAYGFDALGRARYVLGFTYEARTDALVDCKPGFETRMTKRLAEVAVSSSDAVRRSYRFIYQTEAQAGTLTKLAAVYQYGLGGAGPYPIIFRFDYSDVYVTNCANDDCRKPQLVTLGSVGVDFRSRDADLIDMNGDGLPDVLDTTGGRHQIFINEITPAGTHRLRAPVTSTVAGSGSAALSAPNVQMTDLDGDGFTDLVDGNNDVVYRNHGLGDWASAVPLEASLPDFAGDANLQFFDWNGDKAMDVLHTDASSTWVVPNRGDGVYEAPVFTDDALGMGVADGMQLSDMNGDGLPDAVRVLDAAVAYRPNLGYGRFGDWHEMFGFPAVLPDQVSFTDIDGDGLPDALIVLGNEIRWAPNRSGTDFGEAVVIKSGPNLSLPERTSEVSVRFADMNGNGSTDIVWIDASGKITYLELEPIRPNLLTRVRNGLGKVIELSYGSTVQEMARDGGPDGWVRRLPQPHLVLKTLSHFDSISGVRQDQTFGYHDGYFDGVEQQFRGFERVDVATSGDASIEVGSATHTYDLGVTDRYRHGLEVGSDVRSGGRLLQTNTSIYGDCPLTGVAVTEPPIRWICQIASESEAREGRPAAEGIRMRTETAFDGYGNAIKTSNLGQIAVGGHGCDACDPADADVMGVPCGQTCTGDESYSEMTYAVDATRWMLRSVASEKKYGKPGSDVVAESRTYYDGEAFVGLPLGQIGNGLPTRKEQRIDATTWVDVERNRFDANGSTLETRDARGHARRFVYDAIGLFPLEEHIVFDDRADPYELVMKVELDPVSDRTVSASGWVLYENGVAQSTPALKRYTYDAFGRLTATTDPGDETGTPGTTYAYDLGDPVSRIVVDRRSQPGGPADIRTIMCIDGSGRVYQKRTRLEGGKELYQVTDYQLYDSQGSVRREYQPWVSTGETCDQIASGTAPYLSTLRDGLKRTVQTLTPDPEKPFDDGARVVQRSEYRPLETWEWDGEDTRAASPHFDTPTLAITNGMGQVVRRASLDRDRNALWSIDVRYDELGRIARVTDPTGKPRLQTYDLAGRMVKVDDPDAGVTTFGYDANGNLETQTDASGKTLRFAYDEANRIVAQWDEAAPEATRISHHYDRADGCAGVCTNPTGRRTYVEYPIDGGPTLQGRGKDVNGYALDGSPTRSHIELGRYTFDFTFERDRAGRMKHATYPGGIVLDFQYNARAQITRVPGYIDGVDYTAGGSIAAIRFANGTVTQYHEDGLDRIDRLTTIGPGGVALQDQEVVRDVVGNVTGVRDALRRPGVKSANVDYTFDAQYRLVRADYDSDDTVVAERVDIAYDNADNLVSMISSRADSPAQVGALAYGDGSAAGPHAAVRAGDVTYDYDAAGRVTRRGQDSYTWDFMGRLANVARGTETRGRIVYGEGVDRVAKVEGRRVAFFLGNDFEVRSGVATAYLSLGDRHVVKIERSRTAAVLLGDLAPLSAGPSPKPLPDGEVTAADAMLAARLEDGDLDTEAGEHASPDEMLAGAAQSTLIGPRERVTWMHDDIVGSTVLTTNAEGRELARAEYYPFGETRLSSRGYLEDYSFAGKERDRGSELSYFGTRYLDPKIGRWVSPDLHFATLTPDQLGSSEAVNRYIYARNNPVTLQDSDGKATSNNFNRNGNSAGLSAGNVQANYSHMLGFAWRIRTRDRGQGVMPMKTNVEPTKGPDDGPAPKPKPKPEPPPTAEFHVEHKYNQSESAAKGAMLDAFKAELGPCLPKGGHAVVMLTGRINEEHYKGAADDLREARPLAAAVAAVQVAKEKGASITLVLRTGDGVQKGSQGIDACINCKNGVPGKEFDTIKVGGKDGISYEAAEQMLSERAADKQATFTEQHNAEVKAGFKVEEK